MRELYIFIVIILCNYIDNSFLLLMLYKKIQKSLLLNSNIIHNNVVIAVNNPYNIEVSLNRYEYIVNVTIIITYMYDGNLIIYIK